MKFIITPKVELSVKLFMIFILIGLNFAVYFNGKDLSCDGCVINFEASKRKHETVNNMVFQNFTVNITDLYNDFIEGYCLVEFDKDMGYQYKKNVKEIK